MSAQPIPALEPHFTIRQLAILWGLSYSTVWRMFRDMHVPDMSTRKTSLTSRPYQVLRIPASVVARVHEQRSAGFTLRKGRA